MNKVSKRYLGQPENEIWFYDKDRPYYWLTNFYYNEESQKGSGVTGEPQYPINALLPLQNKIQAQRILLFDENGKINYDDIRYFIGFCKEGLASEKVYLINPTCWGKNVFFKFPLRNLEHKEKIGGAAGLEVGEYGKEIEWATAEHLFQALKFTAWGEEKDISEISFYGGYKFNNDEAMGVDAADYSINKRFLGQLPSLADLFAESSIKSIEWSIYNNASDSQKKEWKINWYLDAIKSILENPNPKMAREFANRADKDFIRRKDWHGEMKVRAMKWVVREKFKHPELRDRLWKTGTKKLIEHSPHDSFWGDGGDGNGKNMLGEILMEIRQEIINERGKCPSVVDESEISDTENKDKKDLIEKNIQKIRAKLHAAKISSGQEIEILGNAWETDYQINWVTLSQRQIENAQREALRKINEWVTRNKDSGKDGPNEDNSGENKKPNGPNNPNKKKTGRQEIPVSPSPVENDQIKSELNAAIETGNVDDILNALKNNQENIINSNDKDLKKAAKNLEDKLDNKSILGIIKGQVQTVLEQEGIKAYDLPVSVRQKYSELGNNNNLRDEIIQEIGKQSLRIIIVSLEEALSKNNITEIKDKEQSLRNFVNSKISYRSWASQSCQDKIDCLFQQVQQQLTFLNENSNSEPSFFRVNNPLLYGFIIAPLGVVMLVRKLRLKRT